MTSSKHNASAALVAMASVVITTFVIAALYIGRDILIPLALAALLAFLLSPLVSRLERWIGRVTATLFAVAILFGIIGGMGWVLTRQVLDLATQLPNYQENIRTKLRSLKMPGDSRITKINATLDELKKELPGATAPAEAASSPTPGTATFAVPQKGRPGGLARPPVSDATPTPVEIVETRSAGPFTQLGTILAPLIGPLGTGALVLLLLVCMLLQREDLRGRLIRVLGGSNISATTRGLDDAAQRVARYLLMQMVGDASYGIVLAVGLYFIGVPHAVGWGARATVCPYPVMPPRNGRVFPITLPWGGTKTG